MRTKHLLLWMMAFFTLGATNDSAAQELAHRSFDEIYQGDDPGESFAFPLPFHPLIPCLIRFDGFFQNLDPLETGVRYGALWLRADGSGVEGPNNLDFMRLPASGQMPIHFEWPVSFTPSNIFFFIEGGGPADHFRFVGELTIEAVPSVLVSTGAVWRYRDGGVDLGTAWRGTNVDVSAWFQGAGQLGFGDGDETTLLDWHNPTNDEAFVTYYFRHAFVVENPGAYSNLAVRLLRDDGAIVYLNGEELFRDLMPEGDVDYRTLALTCAPDDGGTFALRWLNSRRLRTGTNYLAVEVHNCSPVNYDISFDLALVGNLPVAPPALDLQRFGTNVVVSWPTGYVGYRLESTTLSGSVAGPWQGVTNESFTLQGRLRNTNRVDFPQRFFQLRLD